MSTRRRAATPNPTPNPRPEPAGAATAAWPPRRCALGLAILAAASLAGCVVAPLPPGGPWRSVEGPVVEVAPPPLRVEVAPASPGVAYVWIGGYWAWQAGRHVWIAGRWALPPAGHAWVPGDWRRHGPGWRWYGGYWARR